MSATSMVSAESNQSVENASQQPDYGQPPANTESIYEKIATGNDAAISRPESQAPVVDSAYSRLADTLRGMVGSQSDISGAHAAGPTYSSTDSSQINITISASKREINWKDIILPIEQENHSDEKMPQLPPKLPSRVMSRPDIQDTAETSPKSSPINSVHDVLRGVKKSLTDIFSKKSNRDQSSRTSAVSGKSDYVDATEEPDEKDKQCCDCMKCLYWTYRCFTIVVSRIIFFGHSLILLWQVAHIFGPIYWLGCLFQTLMLVDLAVVLIKRRGKEWIWFQPTILCFFLVEIPCIWLLELDKVSEIQMRHNQSSTVLDGFYLRDRQADNESLLQRIDRIDVGIDDDELTLVLEQSVLVVVIIARWLMPKGNLSRGRLSEILLVYLGTGADIGDFFSSLSEREELLLEPTYYFPILIAWSLSLLQFMFIANKDEIKRAQEGSDTYLRVLDVYERVAKQKRERPELRHDDQSRAHVRAVGGVDVKPKTSVDLLRRIYHNARRPKDCFQKIYLYMQSETWSTIQTVLWQDGPYLGVRVVNLVIWNVHTYTMYYFTMKNILVLILQTYRLFGLHFENKSGQDRKIRNFLRLKYKLESKYSNKWKDVDIEKKVQELRRATMDTHSIASTTSGTSRRSKNSFSSVGS